MQSKFKMQPISIITKPAESTQNITFTGNDGACSMEVYSQDVVVSTSAGNHNHGSSKVKLKNVVDFNWEQRFYTGQLLAIHMGGKFLAYAIKVPSTAKPGTWSGMVRVAHRLAERRALLKGMKGEVQDVAFAHIEHQVVLACIDEEGTIFVFNIELIDDGIRHQLLLEVSNEKPDTIAEHRVVWCPYIPDEDEPDTSPEEDGARLLVTTHGNKACMWNVSQLVSKHGAGPHRASAITEGALTVAEHGAPVVDAAFSPDGTALATASRDGYVMFFQVSFAEVYMHNESSPRCLHKWQPHGGKPLSYLYFLDNHKNYNVDVQFWKFAVTGAENNTILKIWSCKSWTCLQTITFSPQIGPQLSSDTVFGLKAVLDAGAGYLLLSDFKRRCLYVLQMARDAEDTVAYCKSISEFLLPYPVLSFGIVDAGLQALKCPSSCADPFHQNGAMQSSDGDSPVERDLNVDDMECESISTAVNGTCGTPEGCNVKAVVRLYVVAPKCLQEGRLLFTPPPTSRASQQCVARHLANLTSDSLGYKDGLTDLSRELDDGDTGTSGADDANASMSSDMQPLNTILAQQSQQLKNLLMRAQTQPGSLMGQRADSPPPQSAPPPQPLNLMTPDAFSSPAKREEDDPPISATPDVSEQMNMQTTTAPPTLTLPVMVNNGQLVSEVTTAFPIDEPPPNICDNKFASAGSSPSREVQEILSLKGSDCFYEDDLEDELNQSPIEDSSKSKSRLNGTATSESYLFPESNLFISTENQNGQKSSDTSWPQINMAKINEANQRKASSDKSASQSVTNLLNLSTTADVPVSDNDEKQTINNAEKVMKRTEIMSLSQKDRSRLDAISFKLEKLVELVSDQRTQLAEVQGELTALRHRPSPEPIHQIIEQALQRYQAQTEQTIEQAISRRWESTVESAAQAASESAAAAAARAAAAGAARALEPLARGLQHELATKLTVTDHLLRDNIQKLVTSKSVIDSLSAAVAQALHGMVRDSFRTAVQQSLVPAVEKAHTQMFKQINAAFQNGTKEFASNTEAAARAAAERGGAAAASHLRAALERHADHLTALPSANELATKLADVTRTVLEQQMSAFREQANAVMQSRSHTPTSSRGQHTPHQVLDAQAQQAQVTSLIASGQLNAAFVAALSASDLRLVVHACRTAEPAHVFGPPPALQPHVLLSLVQQLAADMANDTDLKHRYLEEAIMNLEPNNPVTREHMPVVVRELQKQLTSFLAAHPTHPSARRLKMLLMATESLLKPAAL